MSHAPDLSDLKGAVDSLREAEIARVDNDVQILAKGPTSEAALVAIAEGGVPLCPYTRHRWCNEVAPTLLIRMAVRLEQYGRELARQAHEIDRLKGEPR